MKKLILILNILALVFVLTGCWDSVEINDREYLFAVGIDKGTGGNLLFTAEIPKINEGSEEQRTIISEEALTLSNFYNDSFLKSDKVISDRLMQVIVIGEEVAKEPEIIKSLFDEIQRSPQINRRVKIAVAKGQAKHIIKTEIPHNPIVGRYLSEMLVKLKRESYQEVYTFDEAILNLGTYGSGMIPVVEPHDDRLKIESSAVIKDYRLLGYLNYEQNKIVMLLKNPTYSSLENINIDVEGAPVSLATVDVSLSKDMKLNDNILKVDYYVTLYCFIDSFVLGNKSLEDQNFVSKIKTTAINELSKETEDAIYVLQKMYKTDLLKIKDDLYKYDNIKYSKIQDNYDQVFADADIKVHYNMDIKSVGLSK